MKVLHLSDTTLSGSPYRLSKIFNKYTAHEARYIVWQDVFEHRVFPCDLTGPTLKKSEIIHWFEWADVIHYHNRWRRQEIFNKVSFDHVKNKPSVIQIHSPRLSEDFSDEIESGVPLAIIAQYHPREWEKELSYIVPNMVDLYDGTHEPDYKKYVISSKPRVGYSPSNWNAKGWDNKGYGLTNGLLKRMFMFESKIDYMRIIQKPFLDAMAMKRGCHIGIDEVMTGSYHMSSLEFLAMGCATFAHLDEKTLSAIKEVTGCSNVPWINTDRYKFESVLRKLIKDEMWVDIGKGSRAWMEKYWDPRKLSEIFVNMYSDIMKKLL